MCDEDSCEGLKSSMKAAGENARNVRSAISSVESILASLETDFAKFDYSSYTQPIKEQTQKVAERTEMYNTAVTRYEHKTKELDHTLSNALKLATPDFVPAPLDPSCLGIGEELHFGDSKITGSLEEYITAKIDGNLDEAQIKDILSMLFDKENVDISEYSEEDFGMAFIKLSEEKKRAMLMEMGYNKEQIDSILDSCKGNKAVTVGNSIGRTLIEKIADKDGNKHGRLSNTGKASTLGLAGIKGPGQFNTDFAKTNAGKTNAASATCGTTSNNNQKSKPKPSKNNTGDNANDSSSSSTGNTTSPAADPYAEYKTGDPEVDAEIDRLFEEYGDDLSESYEDENFSWENASNTTRRALSRIVEVDLEKIEYSFSDDECANCLERVETILTYMVTLQGSSDQTVFNSGYLNEMYGYMTNGIAKKYINEFGALQRSDYDYIQGCSLPEIWIDGAGVCFGFEDEYGNVTEMLCHTSIARTNAYIDKCEKENPGCFDHEYSLLEGDTDREKKENLIALYNTAKTSGDIELLDRLFKSDSSYENVFVGDPGNISEGVELILGNHACKLASDSYKPDYTEYLAFANAVIGDSKYAEKYIEYVTIGSALVDDAMIEDVLFYDYAGDEEKQIIRELEIANNNELLWESIYFIYKEKTKDNALISNMKLTPTNSTNFKGEDSFLFSIDIEKYGYYAAHDQEFKLTLNPTDREDSADWISAAGLQSLNRKKEEAAMKALLNTACSVLGSYNKVVGTGLKIALNAASNQTSGASHQALNSNSQIAQPTIYDVFYDVYSKFTNYNLNGKTMEDVAKAALFDSVMGYSWHDERGYYIKLNNYYKIKALKDWDRYGCRILYGDDGEAAVKQFENQYDDILDSVKEQTREYFVFQKYTDEEIKDAMNALIFGCHNDTYVTNYSSIRDIPPELRMACTNAINENRDTFDGIVNEYNDYTRKIQEEMEGEDNEEEG
ncbi:hypothetical protein [Butyrivibrio fibrisolvens]|uniref:hypothetical protein n=1 Tax=Butyrivibrio fibrisolvens TaxID=831 RepID=UPI0012BC9DCD|nr:hypothetical protein [Butyrivibrio fibrisolvens]